MSDNREDEIMRLARSIIKDSTAENHLSDQDKADAACEVHSRNVHSLKHDMLHALLSGKKRDALKLASEIMLAGLPTVTAPAPDVLNIVNTCDQIKESAQSGEVQGVYMVAVVRKPGEECNRVVIVAAGTPLHMMAMDAFGHCQMEEVVERTVAKAKQELDNEDDED